VEKNAPNRTSAEKKLSVHDVEHPPTASAVCGTKMKPWKCSWRVCKIILNFPVKLFNILYDKWNPHGRSLQNWVGCSEVLNLPCGQIPRISYRPTFCYFHFLKSRYLQDFWASSVHTGALATVCCALSGASFTKRPVKMLQTTDNRQLPTATPSFFWKNVSSTWKWVILR
jgi:hypothetical protein